MNWETLRRPLPGWYDRARLGVFVHWGAYSVPGWAEPSGALGEMDDREFLRRNPYSEWYYNTIRIEGTSAALHHRDVHADAPYDDFLDAWTAESFDADDWVDLFARIGADYVIPTTKHHDGITLWDAPGTGTRNTVHRGPRRDLVSELAEAVRRRALRFGVYYSGGLDWPISGHPALESFPQIAIDRPQDAAYNLYALTHVRDLIRRFRPDVLWNDMDWPDSGKRDGRDGLADLFRDYYAAVPDGVVNDRWGVPHHDFRSTEYSTGSDVESGDEAWEHTRGLGLSFGYNRVEGADVTMDSPALARHWVDVVARGGRLLINVGPTADGLIPPLQRATLEGFALWRDRLGGLDPGAVVAGEAAADEPTWTRLWRTQDTIVVFVDGAGPQRVSLPADADPSRLSVSEGASAALVDGALEVTAVETGAGPVVVTLARR